MLRAITKDVVNRSVLGKGSMTRWLIKKNIFLLLIIFYFYIILCIFSIYYT